MNTSDLSATSNIKSANYCCELCKKTYTKKSSLGKHKLLCDYKSKSKLELKVAEEELGDIPSYDQLVKLVQELAFKYVRLEEKVEQMQKWVSQKKQKINVISWLNEHMNATIGFKEWTTMIEVLSQFALSLIDHSATAFQTFQIILEYNLTNKQDFVCPIKCFSQKPNIFYICEKTPDGKSIWSQLDSDELLLLFKKIQSKILSELSKWKLLNKSNIEEDDKLSEQFNKAIIKLMNINIVAHDVNVGRIINNLYCYLKMYLKNLIEYDFEL
jgi:hypothetical protein